MEKQAQKKRKIDKHLFLKEEEVLINVGEMGKREKDEEEKKLFKKGGKKKRKIKI